MVTSRGAARARAKNMKWTNSIVVDKCGKMQLKLDTPEPCILDKFGRRFSYNTVVNRAENPASTFKVSRVAICAWNKIRVQSDANIAHRIERIGRHNVVNGPLKPYLPNGGDSQASISTILISQSQLPLLLQEIMRLPPTSRRHHPSTSRSPH